MRQYRNHEMRQQNPRRKYRCDCDPPPLQTSRRKLGGKQTRTKERFSSNNTMLVRNIVHSDLHPLPQGKTMGLISACDIKLNLNLIPASSGECKRLTPVLRLRFLQCASFMYIALDQRSEICINISKAIISATLCRDKWLTPC